MGRRQFFSQFGLIGLGVGFAWIFSETFLNPYSDRKFALYSIRRELQKGMPRSDVEAVISRHDTPFIMKNIEANSMSLSVKLGGHDWLYLAMEFSDGKLARAYFGGEDNPWDVPKDAPSSLE